ncbi:MAG: MFS transporter [Acidobacteria bacterium]|nr:MFS transporter [Acidobacteriota bacterium]
MNTNVPAVSFRQVLRNRQFFALWVAQLVSNFGDWLALLALFSLVAFRWQGTPYQVSGIFIAFALPWALLGPLAGVFVDRWDLKRTMISSDLVRAALVLLLAWASNVYYVYAVVFALGAVSAFFIPAQNAVIPLLVRREELLVANSINAQTLQLNKIVGPAAAGFLVAAAGEVVCFYLDSLSFLLSAALLSLLTARRPPGETGRGVAAVLADLRQGLSFLAQQPAVRFVVLAMVAALVAIGAFDALASIYVRDVLAAESRVFGFIVSLIGVGSILGSLVIGRFGQRWSRVLLVLLGIGAIGAGVALLALTNTTAAALLISLFLGFGAVAVFVPAQTLIQEETPQELLGRVSSTSWAMLTVAQLVGVGVAGKLAEWVGIRSLYSVAGVVLVLVAALSYGYARLRHLLHPPAPPAPAAS